MRMGDVQFLLSGRLSPSLLKALATHPVPVPTAGDQGARWQPRCSPDPCMDHYVVDMNSYTVKSDGVEYALQERKVTPQVRRQGDVVRLHRNRRIAFERR